MVNDCANVIFTFSSPCGNKSCSLYNQVFSGNGADYGVVSVHHVGVLCENLERSLNFYQNILGRLSFPLMYLFQGSE